MPVFSQRKGERRKKHEVQNANESLIDHSVRISSLWNDTLQENFIDAGLFISKALIFQF